MFMLPLDSAPCNGPFGFRCLSGICIENSQRCIFDLDPLGYVKGCRDVSHLREDICGKAPFSNFKPTNRIILPNQKQKMHCIFQGISNSQ